MHTQIRKEIVLTINFEQLVHFNEFLTYCREQFVNNASELKNVDKIEKEYQHNGRALPTMELDLIIRMGFFVHDLHNHITALYAEKYGRQDHSNSFTIYRGQGLSQTDFNQLKNTYGELLSFTL